MNPQIRFGEDLMSRVSYAMMHPEGSAEMTVAVRKALNGLIAQLAMNAGVGRDEILDITIVGNPIMHHLVLGIDPVPLGSAPFALATDRAVEVRAAELDLAVHPGARVYVLPCIAGHVGADTAGVILAEAPHQSEVVELVVDVGTNAEIVLGNRYFLLAASSPTGPAFEGAQISGGQRAAPGAIERVRIDRETLEPRFRIIGVEQWSDEAGFARGRGRDGRHRHLRQRHRRGRSRSSTSPGSSRPTAIVDGSLAARTPRIQPDGRTFSYLLHDGSAEGRPRIVITQNDVRAIQLAKAALYAGVRLLMDHAGIETVDEIRLAGAFGSQIDTFHAMVLGLIPDAELSHVKAAGNAAGTGALIALVSRAARREIEDVARTVEKIETAVEPRFQEHFIDAMAFPHRIAPFPNLSAVVDLPRPTDGDGSGGRGGEPRRRRRAAPTATREPAPARDDR